MITDSDDIAEVFSLLHDGRILAVTGAGASLTLTVDLPGLAERVAAAGGRFQVHLESVVGLRFKTWPRSRQAEPAWLFSLDQVFGPALEILAGQVEAGVLRITCSQAGKGLDYCGGELFFTAGSARVTDAAGRNYSLEALRALSSGYWQEWVERKQALPVLG